jgi:hypothetical protein
MRTSSACQWTRSAQRCPLYRGKRRRFRSYTGAGKVQVRTHTLKRFLTRDWCPNLDCTTPLAGVSKSPPADWRATQRYRLYRFSHPSSEDAKTTQSVLTPSRNGHGWSPELRRTDSLIKELLDIEMVNGPIQCDQR